MKKVSVVILNWNRKEDTLQTIASLTKSEIWGIDLEIVVVDNGSTEGSPQALRKVKVPRGVGYRLIELPENLGFAEGNNVGMKYAIRKKRDFIILLNDDTQVDRKTVKNLIRQAGKKKVGAVSPKIYFAKGFEFHKKRYRKEEFGKVIWYAGGDIDWDNVYGTNHGVDEVDQGQFDKTVETDFFTGCCVVFPRQVLERVGLFNTRYFAYLEDAELSQRIRSAGYKVLYSPKAHLWHKVAQSSGIGSDLNDYFITRNRMLFGLKYAKPRTKLALVKESFKLLLSGRAWQKKGIRDFYLRSFGKGSWGR